MARSDASSSSRGHKSSRSSKGDAHYSGLDAPLLSQPSPTLERECASVSSAVSLAALVFIAAAVLFTYQLWLDASDAIDRPNLAYIARESQQRRVRVASSARYGAGQDVASQALEPMTPAEIKAMMSGYPANKGGVKRDEKPPAWATPRDAKSLAARKKLAAKTTDLVVVESEDEADSELTMIMMEWVRSKKAASELDMGTVQAPPTTLDPAVERLKKRQQLVEDAFDAVVENMALDPSSPLLQQRSSEKLDARMEDSVVGLGGGAGSVVDATTMPTTVVAGSAASVVPPPSDPKLRALRASNQFLSFPTTTLNTLQRAVQEDLTALGYSQGAKSSSQGMPLWVVGVGARCPTETELPPSLSERHILLCPFYAKPSHPAGKYVSPFVFARPSKTVFAETLAEARPGSGSTLYGNNENAQVLVDALSAMYDVSKFTRPIYRLGNAKDQVRINQLLARDVSPKPIFVVQQADGAYAPQLVDNVAALLENAKKYASKQLLLRPFDDDQALFGGTKRFVLRSWAVILNADPLMALFVKGPVLRAEREYAAPASPLPGAAAAGGDKSPYFPLGTRSSGWTAFPTLRDAADAGLDLSSLPSATYLEARMRQMAAFVVASVGAAKPAADSSSLRLEVQHLCLDFVVTRESKELLLDAVRVDCEFAPAESVLVRQINLLAEEMLMRKTRGESLAFAGYGSLSPNDAAVSVLIDEAKLRDAGGSQGLLDAFEALVVSDPSAETL